jgi:hypothetical protein
MAYYTNTYVGEKKKRPLLWERLIPIGFIGLPKVEAYLKLPDKCH